MADMLDQALKPIRRVEKETLWEKKVNQAVRGETPWFNPVVNPSLRPDMLAFSAGKEWADVQMLEWETSGKKTKNGMNTEDISFRVR
jgi:hypothetical protein